VLRRHAQRDAGVTDLSLGTNEPLCERRLRHQERARDLGRFETTDEAERQRDLRLRRECGVATGEDQLEPFVGDDGLLIVGELLGPREQLRLARERLLPADPVDGRVPGRLDDPGTGIVRRSVVRPAFGSADEGVLYRVLGEVEVAEDAAEDRNRASTLVAVGAGDCFYDATSASRITMGRTSMWP
jgi:hypothetical protein